MRITDEMCRRAIKAAPPNRIQGFATPIDAGRTEWGTPYYIRDTYRPGEQEEIWRGNNYDEFQERLQIEKMRLALAAALSK